DGAAAFDEAFGPMVRRPLRAPSEATGGLELFRVGEATADDAEQLRLLYVATTRAADYLMLSSAVKNLDEPKEAWLQLVAQRFDLKTGDCLATPPPDSAQPDVCVTLFEPDPPKT